MTHFKSLLPGFKKKEECMENQSQGQAEDNIPEIMTLQEVADYLGLHYLTIYRLIQENKIPAAKIGGSWRFRKDVLDEWINSDMHQRFRKKRIRKAA